MAVGPTQAELKAGLEPIIGKPVPVPLKERRATLERRRYVLVIRDLQAELDKKPEYPESASSDVSLVEIVVAFGTQHTKTYAASTHWDILEKIKHKSNKERLQALWKKITPVFSTRLNVHAAKDVNAVKINEINKISDLIDVDLDALKQKAAEAIPEPKIWARLNADGSPKSPKSPKRPNRGQTQGTEKKKTKTRKKGK